MEVLTARQLLEKLVSFPTVSSDSNLALVDWLQTYLEGHGIQCHRHWNEDRQKAALLAHAGPLVPGAIVLSGHSDVVPVAGQPWTTDPWTLVERDGRLYGRGTCDMKAYVALAVWALVRGQRLGLRRPLQLALSYDEEIGCTGAPPMIETLVQVLPRGDIALIGEPSRMAVITGHKTGTGFRIHVKGHEVHSSLLPQGVSAVMEAARLIQWVNDRNARLMAEARPSPFFPPFSTMHVGTISGGTANNITAADCRFDIEMRILPDEDPEGLPLEFIAEARRLDAILRSRHSAASVSLAPFFGVPGLAPEEGGAAEALCRRLTGANSAGVVSYGTEAGHFQEAGYSAVVCGPGDIAQAHQPDEFIEVAEFASCQRFMEGLVEDCL